jgi:uncharacterized protein YbjT (DUF2867 family)
MLERLIREGHDVHALAREPMKLDPPPGPGQMRAFQGDVVTRKGLDEAAAGCDAAIHLVGIIMETGGATFEKAHHVATVNVVNAAKRAGIRRFVQMSALGARADGVSGYQTTKWKAEEVVRASSMDWVILRPSIIFGPRDGFVTQMLQVMRSAPLFRPVVGHGKYLFRPVYIADVVECFVQSLKNPAAVGQTIAVVGGDELTLDALLAVLAECAGVRKPAIHIPFPVMYFNATLLSKFMKRPPVTPDQLRMLQEGSTADPEPMRRIFHVNPIGFREGLNMYGCHATGQ